MIPVASRYAIDCPVCGTSFRKGQQFKTVDATFRCPNCDELLEYVLPRQGHLLLTGSVAAGIILAYRLGYEGLTFIIVAVGAAALLSFALFGILYHIRPPKARQSFKHGDNVLRLTDRPRR